MSMVSAFNGNQTGDTAFVAATGKQPKVKAYSYQSRSVNTSQYDVNIARLNAHTAAGGFLSLSVDVPNFANGGGAYNRSKTDISAVTSILQGGANYAAYCAWLDGLAGCLTTDLNNAPVMLRWYTESNGWIDNADIVIDSMTTDGTTVTVTTRTLHGFVANASFVQIVGAAPAAVNGCQLVSSIVSPTVFRFLAAGAITTQGTSCYLCTGFWWAGRDRSMYLNILVRQSTDYLNRVKGCHNVLWANCIYPYDGTNYWSSNQNNSDSTGSFGYENWWPGDDITDIAGLDYYNRNVNPAVPDLNNATFLSTTMYAASFANRNGRPTMFFEMGFDYAGKQQANFWTDKWLTPLKGMKNVVMAGWWNHDYIPANGDAAYASFQTAMADPVMVHLT
jgi:hypothetical protein